MKKHVWLAALFVLGALFVLVNAPAVQAASVNLTYSCFFPPTHVQSKLAESWCKEVEKRTNGQVTIGYYPGQTLTQAAQCYDGVVNNISDIGFAILQYTRGRFPIMDVMNLPMGFWSGKVATAIINELYDKYQPKELDDVKVMYLHSHGPGFMHTKGKAVYKMEDLKGLKLRSHGPTAEMLQALGGTPVAFPMPELYQALQKGVVDGGIYPLEANKGWRLAEVTDFAIAAYPIAYGLGFFVVMNKDKWADLPADAQKAIDEINQEWVIKHGIAWDDSDLEGIQFLLNKGNSIIGIDPKEAARWKEAVQPVIAAYVKDATAKGLPAQEVVDFVLQRLKDAGEGKFTSKYLAGS